ncbi:GIY-YIG nuclease family protein [Candidatus Uhrbacteria bacterium]|nr:GIY-YIG nuclease family protein [Candidatus Uhrbacteria bacterium]
MYILTNRWDTTLYIGVTSDLARRITEHRTSAVDCFTKKYRLYKLVFVEEWENIVDALQREKQLKGGSRASKIKLIDRSNPGWGDLSNLIE